MSDLESRIKQKIDTEKPVNFEDLEQKELMALSPRRKILADLERALDISIPATWRKHEGENWTKDSPNISNEDLHAIIIGIFQKLDQSPQLYREVRSEVVTLTPGEEDVYNILDSGEEFYSVKEIAEELDIHVSTVRDYLGRLKKKVDLESRKVSLEAQSFYKEYRLTPAFRNLEIE